MKVYRVNYGLTGNDYVAMISSSRPAPYFASAKQFVSQDSASKFVAELIAAAKVLGVEQRLFATTSPEEIEE